MPTNGGRGIRQVGYFDCAGGGQVVVDGTWRSSPTCTRPKAPRSSTSAIRRSRGALATIEVPKGMHSHKVRAANGLMLVNREAQPADRPAPGFQGGIGIFDVSDPSRPREITFWRCGGAGVHRFTFDGRYAYLSPEMDGYVGNIVLILDLADPSRPQEVGRWWMPGQWTAGGETPTWKGRHHRCHHPIRLGNRLYVSYWHGGFVILDIEDMSRPRLVSGLDWSPPVPAADAHRAAGSVPDPRPPRDGGERRGRGQARAEPAGLPLAGGHHRRDATRALRELPVPGVDGTPQPPFTGCHQPCEEVTGTEIPVAWFAHGLRIVDIAEPHAPREVASFLPPVPEGEKRVSSNDVCRGRARAALPDRPRRGLHISSGFAAPARERVPSSAGGAIECPSACPLRRRTLSD